MMNPMIARSVGHVPRRVWIGRKGLSALVRLEYEFPGLPSLSSSQGKSVTPSVTTLKNELTIVTEDSCTASTVTLTYPKAGSSNEMIDEHGACLINKFMNFRSASGMSTLLINRTIEDEGGVPTTYADRYGATMGFTVVPEKALGLLPLLATECSFEKWDVRDAKAFAHTESEAANESAQIVLTENLFAAAFGPQSPAGRSFFVSDLSTELIKSFRARTYGLNGAVLTATGIKDHAAFCTEAASLLVNAPSGDANPAAPVDYMGGESRLFAPSSGYAHVALAFASPASSIVNNVTKHVFSMIGAEHGVSSFSSKGLVGVYAASASPAGLVDGMCKIVTSDVPPDLVKRAKVLAKGEALFAMDGGSVELAKALTASFLESGTVSGPAAVASMYDAVTDKQVKDAIAAMLKSNPSLAAIGDITSVPYHANVRARFS